MTHCPTPTPFGSHETRCETDSQPVIGDRVQYWTPRTGLAAQTGVVTAHLANTEVQIASETEPGRVVYACAGAVWGYAPIADSR